MLRVELAYADVLAAGPFTGNPDADWLLRAFTPTGAEVCGAGLVVATGTLRVPEPRGRLTAIKSVR